MNNNATISVIKRLIIAAWFILPCVFTGLSAAGVIDVTPFGRIDPNGILSAQFFKPASWLIVFWILIPISLVIIAWILKPLLEPSSIEENQK